MGMPYKVIVRKNKGDLNVSIDPQPVATEEKYIPVLSKTFSHLIVEHSQGADKIGAATKLKKALKSELSKFHNLNMIKPKEDKDEGSS